MILSPTTKESHTKRNPICNAFLSDLKSGSPQSSNLEKVTTSTIIPGW
jgi:hypothetical protein